MAESLVVTSPDFINEARMADENTAKGKDISPEICLEGISSHAVSLAVVMHDNDAPLIGRLCHWIMWNIPVIDCIPSEIPRGKYVLGLGGAVQGKAYGKNRYRGPNIPFFFKKPHRYTFTVYVLNKLLKIPATADEKEFLKAAEGNIIQMAAINGTYSN